MESCWVLKNCKGLNVNSQGSPALWMGKFVEVFISFKKKNTEFMLISHMQISWGLLILFS
jgi:hypothetical protein